jgi:hypothetical protein
MCLQEFAIFFTWQTIFSLIHLHQEPLCIFYSFHPLTSLHPGENADDKSSECAYLCSLKSDIFPSWEKCQVFSVFVKNQECQPNLVTVSIPEHFEPGPTRPAGLAQAGPATGSPTKLTGRARAEILKPANFFWPEPGPKCCF